MAWLADNERSFLQAVSSLAFANPFLPQRVEFERAALGNAFHPGEHVWSLSVDDPERRRVNVWRIAERLESLLPGLRRRIITQSPRSAPELQLYEDGVLQLLYQRYYARFYEAASHPASTQPSAAPWRFYREFLDDWNHFFSAASVQFPSALEPAHTFACFRQIQRAFDQIFRDIIGGSMAAARLRASIWQSVFTHDMRRYRRTLYARMGEFATLITGPSGTGKELVARAIAQSRYMPFNPASLTFADTRSALFYPINISALPAALVESELFGHRRGAFTGAVADRKGWLETCPELGSVFLDELGDLDSSIQVKLLRVIETRVFHAVGETAHRRFHGKLIAATNRDLAASIRSETFREDLYFRLCSDQVVTPSLAEQIAESPQVLDEVVLYMARRVASEEGESLAKDVLQWIAKNLGLAYAWPGNYRELDQCVKNVLIRRDYRPPQTQAATSRDGWIEDARAGRLTADQLLSHYCASVYRQTGSYEETGRRLRLDRRTVKVHALAGLRNES